MEDIVDPPTQSPTAEALNDPGDPLGPEIDEENSTPNPPISAPTQDMEVTEDADIRDDASDNESVLSEIDEAQFEDFDPTAIAIEDRPAVAIDETNVGLIGIHKRKRTDDAEGGGKKKKKEGKREKPKKSRKRRDEDDEFEGGEEIDGKRVRKRKDGATGGERRERVKPRRASPENEDDLTPEERRKRALDRAMDEALRNPNKRRRRKDGIDLDAMADAEIEEMRRRMTEAAIADNQARKNNQPALHKLKMLPEVVSLLNRNTLQNSLVDPDINLLQAVKFFLEPLEDGSLPAYNIQRELFAALAKLPINKDALVASGIGKVTLFYTKSNRPELGIKRQAEKLLAEWTRPILKRTDDYRKREYAELNYDPRQLPIRDSQANTAASSKARAAADARERALAAPSRFNRARPADAGHGGYTIVPRNEIAASQGQYARAAGASADAALRRMKARQMGKAGGGSRR